MRSVQRLAPESPLPAGELRRGRSLTDRSGNGTGDCGHDWLRSRFCTGFLYSQSRSPSRNQSVPFCRLRIHRSRISQRWRPGGGVRPLPIQTWLIESSTPSALKIRTRMWSSGDGEDVTGAKTMQQPSTEMSSKLVPSAMSSRSVPPSGTVLSPPTQTWLRLAKRVALQGEAACAVVPDGTDGPVVVRAGEPGDGTGTCFGDARLSGRKEAGGGVRLLLCWDVAGGGMVVQGRGRG
jgi:hypothetical protein